MISASSIAQVVEKFIAGSDLFLVDITVSPFNDVEVVVDKPSGLTVEDCADVSRAVEAAFDRDKEDFALTVASPGLGEPLKILPQYRKALGKEVEILLKSGAKLTATLTEATTEKIAVEYAKMEAVEGKKRKQPVACAQALQLADVKWVKLVVGKKC
ncbi:MAG: ribosome assembly cofactor RimP [Prevotellaceae bacterium]|jgi:ribosome maturation factor RimP|nr:ribosome assembly cofactor RimP [Prevotellaceae bacterium]